MSRVLIVSKCPTHPTIAGNRQWILAQAELLSAQGHEVHFLYVQELPLRANDNNFEKDFMETKAYWGDRFHCFQVSKIDKIRMAAVKYYRKTFQNSYFHCDDRCPAGLTKHVERLHARHKFDACIVNYYYLSKLLESASIPLKALSTHDSFAYKNLKVDNPRIFSLTAHQEAVAMQRSPHIFALQEQEADYFQILSPKSHVYCLYGSFPYHPQPVVGNHKILFLSGSNPYNLHGIRWFLRDVFPKIRARFADAEFIVGGSICKVIQSEIRTQERVSLLGFVENPASFYALGDVAINPISLGTGLKIKTFEALSYDKVTLVHPHSIIGIYKKESAPLFASEKPEEWVDCLAVYWGNGKCIEQQKTANASYLRLLQNHVVSQYQQFLSQE